MSEYMYSHAAAAVHSPYSSTSSHRHSHPSSRRPQSEPSLETFASGPPSSFPLESRASSSGGRPDTGVSQAVSSTTHTTVADLPITTATTTAATTSSATDTASTTTTTSVLEATKADDTSSPRASTSTAPFPSSPRRKRFTASSFAAFSSSTTNLLFSRSSKRKLVKSPLHSPSSGFPAADLKHVAMVPDSESNKSSLSSSSKTVNNTSSFSRTESVSSTSVNTALSGRTVTSTENSASGEVPAPATSDKKAFVQRNGRTYFNDPTLPDPLPVDLAELHRQALRTMLYIQVHGAPFCCPSLTAKPPLKVLELGCGTGFWSMMCHRHFKSRGHSNIAFTGVDIAPLAPGSANVPSDGVRPDPDMNWTFVQHDLRQQPWPFADNEFDLVFHKDLALSTTVSSHTAFLEEELRILKPGGVIEIWECDYTTRMLRPHVPNTSATGALAEQQEIASSLGAYIINLNTPLSAPLNTFLIEHNNWVTKALEARHLLAAPSTVINHYLLQEIEVLRDVGSHRVAVPFSEVRWEREGVGGVVTRDGKSYVEMKGDRGPHQKVEKKALTAGQAALRRMALLVVVEQIQSLEPILREASGKSQDEWDVWMGKMMNDLMSEGGTSWGECLEIGAWWAVKR